MRYRLFILLAVLLFSLSAFSQSGLGSGVATDSDDTIDDIHVSEVVVCADGEEAIRVTKYNTFGSRLSIRFEKPNGTVFNPTTFNDCGSGIDVNTNNLGVLFAFGQQDSNTTGQSFNSSITRTNTGRYTVTFSQPYPEGNDYPVVFGQDEAGNTRDVTKVSVVDGSKTMNGFQVQVTIDDNGQTADTYNDEPWSFQVAIRQRVVTSIQPN